MMGHTDVVKLLLENGADPEKVGINGATPLHSAAFGGHSAVAALLESGAVAEKWSDKYLPTGDPWQPAATERFLAAVSAEKAV